MGRGCVTLLLLLDVISCYNVVRKDPFASLSETLVTRQRAACDGESASANQGPVFLVTANHSSVFQATSWCWSAPPAPRSPSSWSSTAGPRPAPR